MASAWGKAWGAAWGDAWGAVTVTAPPPPPPIVGGYRGPAFQMPAYIDTIKRRTLKQRRAAALLITKSA